MGSTPDAPGIGSGTERAVAPGVERSRGQAGRSAGAGGGGGPVDGAGAGPAGGAGPGPARKPIARPLILAAAAVLVLIVVALGIVHRLTAERDFCYRPSPQAPLFFVKEVPGRLMLAVASPLDWRTYSNTVLIVYLQNLSSEALTFSFHECRFHDVAGELLFLGPDETISIEPARGTTWVVPLQRPVSSYANAGATRVVFQASGRETVIDLTANLALSHRPELDLWWNGLKTTPWGQENIFRHLLAED